MWRTIGGGAISSGRSCLAEGWDWTLVSCSWPWFPYGTALCPEVTSDPQGAAGPMLGW